MQTCATTREISMEVPQNTKNRFTSDSTIPLLVIYTKECKSIYKRDTCVPIFIAALFTIAKQWKEPRCPKRNMLYIYITYIS
jgi:hypothetical protein